jgi:hypothetical protein
MATGYHLDAGKHLHIHIQQTGSDSWKYEISETHGGAVLQSAGQSPSDEATVKAEAIRTAKTHLKNNHIEASEGWDKAEWKPINL